jgi:CubicO group peptidase (beta-lactamase class C family)
VRGVVAGKGEVSIGDALSHRAGVPGSVLGHAALVAAHLRRPEPPRPSRSPVFISCRGRSPAPARRGRDGSPRASPAPPRSRSRSRGRAVRRSSASPAGAVYGARAAGWRAGERYVAGCRPEWSPGRLASYHYVTFSWIAGGIIERAAGRPVSPPGPWVGPPRPAGNCCRGGWVRGFALLCGG